MQYVLNAFLLLNVAQFVGIVGLAHLDRKQKRAAARRTSTLLPAIEEDSDYHVETPPLIKESISEDEWNGRDSSSQVLGTRPATGTIRSLRGVPSTSASITAEQSIPLLRSPSQSSSARKSSYLAAGITAPSPLTGRVTRTKAEVKRGESFALLCGVMIAFAWILFMGTAYLRLRSKAERSGEYL